VSASQVLLELEEITEEVRARSRCRDAEGTNLTLTEQLREHLRRHMSSKISPQPGRASEDDSVVNLSNMHINNDDYTSMTQGTTLLQQ